MNNKHTHKDSQHGTMHRSTESMENYLVAIFDLEETNRVARVKEIAAYLGVKMPSVTGALRSLKEKGLVNHEKNSFATLTEEGRRIAIATKDKRELLEHFFRDILLLPGDKAQDVACQVEHDLDSETTQRLRNTLDFLAQALEQQKVSVDSWRQRVATDILGEGKTEF